METDDTYKTIEKPSEGSFRDRGSRFIGLARPCCSHDEAKEILAAIRREYYDATHHCFAYRLGAAKTDYRLSDDGEPSGTAGRPIYGQLLSFDLSDILVVVVRYYGGSKLGASGLINAYRTAAREALLAAEITDRTVMQSFRLRFGYEQMNDVMRVLKDESLKPRDNDFGERCSLLFSVRQNDAERVSEIFRRMKGVEVEG